MFGREPREASNRQHVLPPSPTGYTFERVGQHKMARPSDSDLLSIVKSIAVSVGVTNSRSMASGDGRYFASLGNHELFIAPTGRGSGYDWSVEQPGGSVVLEGYGMTSGEIIENIRSSGVVASRKSNRKTAGWEELDIPEPRHKVSGWDWDDHLNGFLAAEASREFTCACGENVPAPGYTDCRCGKRWNVYSVQSPQGQKLISREVPVRENVVMATRTASHKQADFDEYRELLLDYGATGDVNTASLAELVATFESLIDLLDEDGDVDTTELRDALEDLIYSSRTLG